MKQVVCRTCGRRHEPPSLSLTEVERQGWIVFRRCVDCTPLSDSEIVRLHRLVLRAKERHALDAKDRDWIEKSIHRVRYFEALSGFRLDGAGA